MKYFKHKKHTENDIANIRVLCVSLIGALHILAHLFFYSNPTGSINPMSNNNWPILQVKKLRHREGKQLVQGDIARHWQSWDLNPRTVCSTPPDVISSQDSTSQSELKPPEGSASYADYIQIIQMRKKLKKILTARWKNTDRYLVLPDNCRKVVSVTCLGRGRQVERQDSKGLERALCIWKVIHDWTRFPPQ